MTWWSRLFGRKPPLPGENDVAGADGSAGARDAASAKGPAGTNDANGGTALPGPSRTRDTAAPGSGAPSGRGAPGASSAPEGPPRPSWIPADKNRFGIPVLDLIAVTGAIISASKDPQQAALAMSWGKKLAGDLAMTFSAATTLTCNLRYAADPGLPDGWLFEPTKMEHKWAIAYRDGAIYLLRSWTGHVNAIARTHRDGDDLVVDRLELADDALRTFGDPVETFDWMLRAHALGDVAPMPVSPEGAALLESAPLAVFGLFGHVAMCAATSWAPRPQGRALRSASDLLMAVRTGQSERIAELVSRGAINARSPVHGLTALQVAVIQGKVELVTRLLELGADPNVLADRDASAVITAIVHRAPISVLDVLAAHGAVATTPNADGFGMIHAIAETDRPEYLAWAIAHGVDLEARTRHGHSALHVAAGLGHAAALRALLAAGADPRATDPAGKTARDIAVAERKPAAVEALDASG